jgi:tetratricopeptide (TPR) repeat protein
VANEESSKALSTFQQALLIDPENEEALYGVHRANNLDHVLALYKEGLRLESENNLEQAQQLLQKASQTDNDFAPAEEALKRVETKRQDLSFQAAMSRAITALNNEQLTVADKALEEAEQLRPQNAAMIAARQRSIEMQ